MKKFAGLLIALAIAAPVATSALSVADIQAQIQALFAKLSELRLQLQTAEQAGGPVSTSPVKPDYIRPRVCDFLERRLLAGESGEHVMSLQEFLKQEGIFKQDATGYFGPVTAEAVKAWQLKEGVIGALGAPGAGLFGPRSREFLLRRCGGTSESGLLRASPQQGAAPLTVTFGVNVGGLRPAHIRYEIDFGDGTRSAAPECLAPADACTSPGIIAHTYVMNGKYEAKLIKVTQNTCQSNTDIACAAWYSAEEVVGRVYIAVGETGPIACTLEYAPVCGAKSIVCITTPCDPIPTTYGNKCAMQADGASFLYMGECGSQTYPDPAQDPMCKSWNDGCNTCGRSEPGGMAACTLRYCVAPGKPYCTAYFPKDTSSNKPPTIHSVEAPTVLAVNETGTWKVNASDPENGSLSYRIDWGDSYKADGQVAGGAPVSQVQQNSFTHSYAYAGTYTIYVYVTDNKGAQAKWTTTVAVGGGPIACTKEYMPVCATPYYCQVSKYAAGQIPLECLIGKTYGNRCTAEADKASFLYQGQCQSQPIACTADARQCPDGSYVGRTGPNCKFVCSGGVVFD